MNDIKKLNTEDYALVRGTFDTLDNTQLAEITSNMPMIQEAKKSTGRSQTQTTIQLMTLNMMAETPLRRLRQIAAEIEKKNNALQEAYFRVKEAELDIEECYEDGSKRAVLKAQKAEAGLFSSQSSIEGALKDIGTLQQAYKDIKETYDISDDWNEADLEAEENTHHIRLAFKQAYRDVLSTGRISLGNQEYLEQFGIHPHSADALIKEYIVDCSKMIEEGKMPTASNLYVFIDSAAEMFKEAPKEAMKRIGLKSIQRDNYLYLGGKDEV